MAEDKACDVEKAVFAACQPASSTLLPHSVAQAVSLVTRSTSLAIRVGSLVSAYGLDAARLTTLFSLQLTRGMVEGVLSRPARDTLTQSSSEIAAAEAETILERSLESLHYAVTQVLFWTSASFFLTGTTPNAAAEASQLLLSSLDELFGSTDSSRAVASIITLIRREFKNPATGARDARVGVVDFVLALGALAYLQRACRRTPSEESRCQAYEEKIWDIVVLSDGQRVDVDDSRTRRHASSEAVQQGFEEFCGHNDKEVLARLKSHIVNSLPPGTAVSISNSVSSVQKIAVDVQGSQLPQLPTPPGAEIIETRGPSSPASTDRSQSHAKANHDT